MSETIQFLAVGVIIFLIARYVYSSVSSPSTSSNRRRRVVPQSQIDAVQNVLPHLSLTSIRYDLERTGSVQATIERALTRGSLEEPPAGFFDVADPASTLNNHRRAAPAPTPTSSQSSAPKGPPSTLISRLGLEPLIKSSEPGTEPSSLSLDKGKGKDLATSATSTGWDPDPNAREKSLMERKKRMVLEARKRLMEREKEAREKGKQKEGAVEGGGSVSA